MIALGALSGLLSGLMMMTISIPLVGLTFAWEEQAATARTTSAAESIDRWLRVGSVLTTEKIRTLGVTGLSVSSLDAGTLVFHNAEGDRLASHCGEEDADGLVALSRETWALTCRETASHRIVVGARPDYESGRQILYITFFLAIIVGIVTALGQARLLQPLSQMANAVEQLGRGQRSQRLASTGLAEFDTLVDRINETAENVEQRVDGITARITVVQEMARIVAHEVRNPLQSLELLTTLVAMEEDPAERKAIAESIHQEIRILEQVVHRLLRDGSGTGALRLQRREEKIVDLVERAVGFHRAQADRRGIQMSVGAVSHATAFVDVAMLSRCLENLLMNAMQAVTDDTGEIRLSVFEESDHLVIACDDNGPGVPEQLRDTLFESNVTGRDGGHGLGLALVKAVLVAHEGSIEHAPSPLGGARFLARIPMDKPDESPDA